MGFFKGQSGIEYLTTYGWMLVAVSVVGGTMYTQVGGQECRINTQGFSPPFPTVQEVYQYENETLLMSIRNPDSDSVRLNEMVIREDGEEVGIVDLNRQINGEATENVYTSRFSSGENCVTRNVQINYDSGSLNQLTTNGTLTGKLSLVPIKALLNVNTTFVDTEEQIEFNASISESENDIKYYNWSFGDGTTIEGNDPVVTHNYSEEAVYTVELEVEDQQGLVDTETVQIFVGGLLRRSGGNLSSIEIGETLITNCVGGDCTEEYQQDSTVAKTEGDYILGTLFTHEILKLNNELCVTDYSSAGTDEGCRAYRQGESQPISEESNTVFGSFKAPSIKPLNGDICFGDCG